MVTFAFLTPSKALLSYTNTMDLSNISKIYVTLLYCTTSSKFPTTFSKKLATSSRLVPSNREQSLKKAR